MTNDEMRELLAACLLRLQQLEPYAELTRRVGEVLAAPAAAKGQA